MGILYQFEAIHVKAVSTSEKMAISVIIAFIIGFLLKFLQTLWVVKVRNLSRKIFHSLNHKQAGSHTI